MRFGSPEAGMGGKGNLMQAAKSYKLAVIR